MKELITMSRKEVHRARVMEQVSGEIITLKEAAGLMHLSYRQAKPIYRRWRDDGLSGLCHRNRGRQAGHALPPQLPAVVLALHDEVYRDFNDTHFTEALQEREGIAISREKVRQIRRAAGHGPKRKRRPRKAHRRRPRKTQAGVMMQWDGSPHHWFGKDRQCQVPPPPRAREPRPSTPTRGSATKCPASATKASRPRALGSTFPLPSQLATSTDDRPARNRRPLAPPRLAAVLANEESATRGSPKS